LELGNNVAGPKIEVVAGPEIAIATVGAAAVITAARVRRDPKFGAVPH